MMPEQSMPQYITLTNQADNSEVRGIMEGGKFRQIPVDKLTTPSGTFAMQTSTNAAPIYLPDGSVAQNYTGDPSYGRTCPNHRRRRHGCDQCAHGCPLACPTATP
jgi:hypothetical protein